MYWMQFSISVISLENFYLGVQDDTAHNYSHKVYIVHQIYHWLGRENTAIFNIYNFFTPFTYSWMINICKIWLTVLNSVLGVK